MRDTWLVAIALAVSSAGIVCLAYAMRTLEPPLTVSLDTVDDGSLVRMRGKLDSITARGGVTIISIAVEQKIQAVLFEERNLSLEQDSCVLVTGKKGTYKDAPQLVLTKIARCG